MTPIEIPYATGSLRLIMGGACLAFVVLSLVWTVPKIANFIHTRGTRTKGQNVGGSLIWIFIIGFTLVPSTIFAALVKNPTTVIADEGITQENLFSSSAEVIGWNEIERVSCTYVRSHPLTYECPPLWYARRMGERFRWATQVRGFSIRSTICSSKDCRQVSYRRAACRSPIDRDTITHPGC